MTSTENLVPHKDGESAKKAPLRVAVVGAGLVGSVGILALSRLKNVKIAAFERSPGPREAGAWISLTVSSLLVLNQFVEPDEVNKITYRPPNRGYIARHWRTGEILRTSLTSECFKDEYVSARTRRVPLLRLLLSHVPEGIIKYGRKVVNVENLDDGVRLIFEDGSAKTFDLVVAADGIYSKIRQTYFPEHRVGYKGIVAYRKCFPLRLVENLPGLHNDSSSWRRDGETVFLSRLGMGFYGIVILKPEPGEVALTLQWQHSVGPEKLQSLREHFAKWDPIIGSVLNVIDDIDAYPLDSGPWLQDLNFGDRIVFVGDAAHPTAGAYGVGSAMGYGDCWALYRSLESTYQEERSNSKDAGYDLRRAMRLFNETRRPFLRRVEKQMAIDARNAKYIRGAGDDEREWTKRFRECNPPSIWMSEHHVENEFQRVFAEESGWSQRETLDGIDSS